MKKELGIYIHIPFCMQKCRYCDFLSKPETKETRAAYVEALKQELWQEQALAQDYEAVTVFLGGGTPSMLEAEQTADILQTLYQVFPVREDAEITMECNPGTLTAEKLFTYREAGVNRLSLGLQSANNEELKLLGRIHTYEEFLESFRLARAAGFSNLNVDLMSALPGQTPESYRETLHKVLALSPEHISAYSLIIEEGTPFYEQYGTDRTGLPDEDSERQMYYDTEAILTAHGYERYEISNYARPGFHCRHNLSYWERKNYKGFGIGAASLMENVRYKNADSLSDYLRGCYRIESRETLTRKEQMEEFLFLGLRKISGISKEAFFLEFGAELEEVYGVVLEKLKGQALLAEKDGRIWLTDRGIDVSNLVLAEFLLD